jgi:hypothetical protein
VPALTRRRLQARVHCRAQVYTILRGWGGCGQRAFAQLLALRHSDGSECFCLPCRMYCGRTVPWHNVAVTRMCSWHEEEFPSCYADAAKMPRPVDVALSVGVSGFLSFVAAGLRAEWCTTAGAVFVCPCARSARPTGTCMCTCNQARCSVVVSPAATVTVGRSRHAARLYLDTAWREAFARMREALPRMTSLQHARSARNHGRALAAVSSSRNKNLPAGLAFCRVFLSHVPCSHIESRTGPPVQPVCSSLLQHMQPVLFRGLDSGFQTVGPFSGLQKGGQNNGTDYAFHYFGPLFEGQKRDPLFGAPFRHRVLICSGLGLRCVPLGMCACLQCSLVPVACAVCVSDVCVHVQPLCSPLVSLSLSQLHMLPMPVALVRRATCLLTTGHSQPPQPRPPVLLPGPRPGPA